MRKTERTGGIWKSPAIDKINLYQKERNVRQRAEAVRDRVFQVSEEMEKMDNIIARYNINYGIKEEVGEEHADFQRR